MYTHTHRRRLYNYIGIHSETAYGSPLAIRNIVGVGVIETESESENKYQCCGKETKRKICKNTKKE